MSSSPSPATSRRPQLRTEHHFGRGFDARVALAITRAVGSMRCAYAFALLALISLPAAVESASLIVIVAWIAQTFLQLVLLSVIMVGQDVQNKAADARAEHTAAGVDKALDRLDEHTAGGITAIVDRLDELAERTVPVKVTRKRI